MAFLRFALCLLGVAFIFDGKNKLIGGTGHMTKNTIYLFRHGQTEWNVKGRRQGHLDSPLTAKGHSQALKNARRLQRQCSLNSDVTVFVSPLGRSRQTALLILAELGLPEDRIDYEPGLMESSFGLWEGLTDAEVAKQFPDTWQARTADRWNVRPPSGESYADVHARVAEWYESVSIAETTLVVCHGLTSRVFRGIYAGLSHQQVFDLPEPQDGFFKLSDGIITYVE